MRRISYKHSMSLLLLCLFIFQSSLWGQEKKEKIFVSGRVLNEESQPLPNVSIYVKDKAGAGTTTNKEGGFKITVDYGEKLVFSFVGFNNQELLAVKNQTDTVIILQKKSTELGEIIVVGLGTEQRKISSVGAITSVNVKDLQAPAASITNLLGGRAAGVISLQGSGEPGKNIADFWIRGIGTFGANTGALVLIDGLEGDLNTIDPADVESFSILKDASATAVYGVRGANGVVLVTTKKGMADRLQITARANTTLSVLSRLPKYLGSYDYALLANEAVQVRGEQPLYSKAELGIIKDHMDTDIYPNVNWQNEVLNKDSWRQGYYLSGRGGSGVARYFLSLGGRSESAAYKVDRKSVYSSNVGFSTYNYRINLDVNLSKNTSVFLGSDGFLSNLQRPGIANTDYIWEAQSTLTPLAIPKQYSNGLLPALGANGLSSPYVMINRTGKGLNQVYKGKITLALMQNMKQILPGLKFRVQGAYDIHSFFNEHRYIQPALFKSLGRNHNGELIMQEMVKEQKASYSKGVLQYRKFHLESTINYDRIFAKDHRVSGLIYYYLSDAKHTKNSLNNMSAIPERYQGVSSRLTYGFRDTYLFDVNFGYTGSENFQPGRQYGFFPSVAMGWVPTSYKLVQEHMPWLGYFKIRGSYGTVGNDRITERRFPYLTRVNVRTEDVWGRGGIESITESSIGADNLAWEKAIKSNIGIEGKLFDNKLDFVVDYFQDQRNGIFQQRVQVPEYVGVISMPFGNVGRMKSFGADGNVSYSTDIFKELKGTIRANFTYSKNMIQNWEQAYLEHSYLEFNGYPLNAVRGYQAIGLFKDENDIKYSPIQTFGEVAPGDIKYKDVNGDGRINALDRVPLSRNTFPVLMYGMGMELSFKQFSLGLLFKGTGSTPFYNVGQGGNGLGYVPFFNGSEGNVVSIANDPKNRWVPKEYALANGIDPSLAENPNAIFPRLDYGRNRNNTQLSTFWKRDSRYIRLQELTLSYRLQKDLLRRIGVSSMDIQFIGNNLYIWDQVKLFDPEQAQWNGSKYPIPATYSLQLYINL
ncbi:SusC/RagA family TonB-linked outer membrane protein [Sphingobacterium kyonggiense]